MTHEFASFGKIARWSREIVITEKIDGTNAQIFITEDGQMLTGSRTRWITPEDDNFGFARWAQENRDELMKLGPGRHFGEWWGQGIQRKYGLDEKRFSLFNTSRWNDETKPACCHVVPILYAGVLGGKTNVVENATSVLRDFGSAAVPKFMDPEGIVIYHVAANTYFKKTLKKDDEYKSKGTK